MYWPSAAKLSVRYGPQHSMYRGSSIAIRISSTWCARRAFLRAAPASLLWITKEVVTPSNATAATMADTAPYV